MRVVLLFLGIFIIGLAVVWSLGRLFPRKPLLKYIPAIPTLGFAIYYSYLSTQTSTGFEDLAQLLFALMLFDFTLAIILTGLFFDYFLPRIRK